MRFLVLHGKAPCSAIFSIGTYLYNIFACTDLFEEPKPFLCMYVDANRYVIISITGAQLNSMRSTSGQFPIDLPEAADFS